MFDADGDRHSRRAARGLSHADTGGGYEGNIALLAGMECAVLCSPGVAAIGGFIEPLQVLCSLLTGEPYPLPVPPHLLLFEICH